MLLIGSTLDAHQGDGSLATDTARVVGTDLAAVQAALVDLAEEGYLQVAAVDATSVRIIALGSDRTMYGGPRRWYDAGGFGWDPPVLPELVHTGPGAYLVLAGAPNDTAALESLLGRVDTLAAAQALLDQAAPQEYVVLDAQSGQLVRANPDEPLHQPVRV